MKKKLSVISIVLGALAIVPSVSAQMNGRYGGHGRGGISRSGGAMIGGGGGGVGIGRGLGISRPSVGGGLGNFRPMTSVPQIAPISRPNFGGMRVPNAPPTE